MWAAGVELNDFPKKLSKRIDGAGATSTHGNVAVGSWRGS